jgi:tetratricopeptide (TPR) repeat protein
MDERGRDGRRGADRAGGLSRSEISAASKAGYRHLREDRVDEAIDCFASILSVDEGNNYALVGMGDAVRKQGSARQASSYYRRCLERHPANSYAMFGLADCYKAMTQYSKAIEVWEQYLQHDANNITVMTRVANAHRKLRNFKRAKAVFLQVLDMEEDNAYAIIGLGRLHYDFKNYKEALAYLERMPGLRRGNADVRVLTSIGNCHRKMKSFPDGVPFFERVLTREPGNFYAIFGLADCYRGMRRQEQALVYWNRILAQDPRNKVILTRAGDAHRTMGAFEPAQECYEKALNIEFDIYAVLGLALISKAQGRLGEAASSLRALARQDSKNHRLIMELADCLVLMGDRRAAAEALEGFQKSGPRNPCVAEMLEKI